MDNEFVKALLSDSKSSSIPEEHDWYKPLLGDWEFDYVEACEGGRRLKGEWLFRRVLDGMAIEDIFICPARGEVSQPDGEYGAAIRMYNAEKECYDMVYTCRGKMDRLEVRKENNRIVCTMLEKNEKWIFSEISESTFHWRNVTVHENGEWSVNCDVFAKRRK